jgi:hypothetical protein
VVAEGGRHALNGRKDHAKTLTGNVPGATPSIFCSAPSVRVCRSRSDR